MIEGGVNIDIWTFEELKDLVEEFKNNSKEPFKKVLEVIHIIEI